MDKYKCNNFMQGALRTGVSLFLLSGACVFSGAQAQTPASKTTPATKTAPVAMREISGHVYDAATNAPLAGVRVQALNNRYYTTLTDDNGAYTIKVPEYVTALYVAIPERNAEYNASQIAIKGTTGQDAYLNASHLKGFYKDGIDVVTNAEMLTKETSAITIENDVENHLNANVRTISRGGMPAQGAAMFINGIGSLNANAQPLVIIDGVMWDMQYDRTTLHDGFFNNVFNIVDPEDIESVEVLNNGTALYGAKGANGVLRITTKRGHSQVTRINIRAFGGFELVPEKTTMMNANQYRNYVTELIGTTPEAIDYFKTSTTLPPFMNEDPSYLYYDVYHQNTDWQKDLYRNAFTQNYKVSVEGGDDVAMYNLSLGYTQSNATAEKNDFNRLNIRFNTDINLFKNFVTGMDISYVRNAYNLRDNGWAESYDTRHVSAPNVLGLIQSPFISPYAHYVMYNDGQLQLGHAKNIYSGKNYTDGNNPYRFADAFGYSGFINPFWILRNGDGDNKNYQEQTQFAINVNPRYTINKYLTVSDRFSYMINRNNEKYFVPKDGTPAKEVEGLGSIRNILSTQFGKETTLFNDFQVSWDRQFKAHRVSILGGFRLASYSYSDSHVTGYNNDNDKMPNISKSLSFLTSGGTNDSWINLAYYLNARYNFKNRYFIDFTTSMESSSRFGKEAKEGLKLAGVKWGIFPSIQAAWVMSNEKWFNVDGINYLKISAGYEESGNDNVDYYATRTYFENVKFLGQATALQLANIQNPAIQWETNRRFNVGLQGSFLKDRLGLGLNFYAGKTSNLLTRKAVSDITGLRYMWANEGALKNVGLDARLNAILVNRKNFKWEAGFTVGHYRNEITELPTSSLNYIRTYELDAAGKKVASSEQRLHGYTTSVYGDNNVLTAVGTAAGVFYGYKTNGVFSTEAEAAAAGKYGYLRYPTGLNDNPYREFHAGDVRFVDQNGDGWISEADMVVIGDPNPDIFGNIFTSFTWKDLTLDLNFKYSLGNDIYNYQRSQLEAANNIYNQTTAVCNRWRYEGQITDMPRAMAPGNDQWVNNERFSDRWIEDGSFLKLKKVRLTYKVPVRLSWLLGLSIWGEANNVFTVSKYLGNDPEVSCGNSVLYQGVDAGYLPLSRNFNIGLTINL